jgi:predicted O-methyltransferase YrrM
LTLEEKLLLYKLARELEPASVIVEVGSYLGASSTFLAAAAKERRSVVYCVDTWANEGMSEGLRDTYAEFTFNTQRYTEQIRPLRGTSLEIAEGFLQAIDLLFLDADHSYAACRSDAQAWLPKVKPGGIVVFHDIGWAEGVQRTVRELVKPIERSPGHALKNIYWARIGRSGEAG